MARRNIEIILGGLVDAVRNQDPECITQFLAADLVWEGLAPGLRCDGRVTVACAAPRHSTFAVTLLALASPRASWSAPRPGEGDGVGWRRVIDGFRRIGPV
jgi:hypothetical protein